MRPHREKSLGDDGDDRRAMLLKCFRCGARRPWCRLVWKSAIKACGGTQDAAARRLFVTTSAVSEGLQHGRLSIETLVVMMAELAPNGWRLPELPPRHEMIDEGLIEAMAFSRDSTKPAAKRRRLTRDDLALLAALHADKEWPAAMTGYQQAQRGDDSARARKAESRLKAIATRALAVASRRRGVAINHSVARLRELSTEWLLAFAECRDAIPFDWSDP